MTVDTVKLNRMHAASGRNDKLAVMRTMEGEDIKEFFRLACDPAVKFYTTVDVVEVVEEYMQTVPQNIRSRDSDVWWQRWFELLGRLSRREVSGNDAKGDVISHLMVAPDEISILWAARCLMKDLRSGVSVSTVNKVWPGLIDDLSVMLALPYDPEKHDITGSWNVEPKLDGYRMTIIDGVPLSRNKREFTSVDHILEAIGPELLERWVFDGEIMGSSADFDEAGGSIRRKSEQASGAVYHVFDIIFREDWQGTTPNFGVRRHLLESVCKDIPFVKVVPSIPLQDPTSEQLFKAMKEMIALGYEGAMLKNATAPYVYDRTPDLLKLKDFVSEDLPVVGYTPGKGRHKGSLGALYVLRDGVQTKVGSGYSDAQRKEIWEKREQVIGQIIECQFQNLTKDGRLRFPVFLRFRPDKG